MIGIGIGVPFNFSSPIDADATTIYNRIIADGGVSNLTRLNFFVKGLKGIYGSLTNVPVCYDAHWIGYKLGSGTGATAGQAVAKLYSLTVAGDAVQSTAASQPLLLAHNGESSDNYWYSPRIVGNTITTPRTIATGYNGAFEIEAKVKFIDLTGTFNYPTIFSVGENYALGLGAANGQLFVLFGGGNTAQTTNTIPSNFDGYVRLVRSGATYTYYTSLDGVNWTLLEVVTGTNIAFVLTGTNTTISNYNTTDNRGQFNGNIYRVRLWINGNRSTGTLSFDFNPATYNASTSQTAWTSATGEIWTINTGTATTGYKGVLVDRTIVQGDGINDGLLTASNLSVLTNFSYYASIKGFKGPSAGKFIDADYIKQFSITADSTVANFVISTKVNGGAPYGVLKTFVSNTFLLISTTRISSTGVYSVGINDASYTNSTDGVAGATVADKLAIFQSTAATQFGQNIINTFILASQTDTPAQRTAMYNLIRSLNNNAF